MGKKQKKHGGQLQCSYSRHFGWKEIKRPLKNQKKTEQAIKLSFMNAFAEWVKLYVAVNLMSLIGLVNWISSE